MEMIYFRISGLPSNDSRNDKRKDKRTEDESVGLLFVTVFLFLKSLFFPLAVGYSRPLDVSLMKTTSGFIENINLCLNLDFVGRGSLPI